MTTAAAAVMTVIPDLPVLAVTPPALAVITEMAQVIHQMATVSEVSVMTVVMQAVITATPVLAAIDPSVLQLSDDAAAAGQKGSMATLLAW